MRIAIPRNALLPQSAGWNHNWYIWVEGRDRQFEMVVTRGDGSWLVLEVPESEIPDTTERKEG